MISQGRPVVVDDRSILRVNRRFGTAAGLTPAGPLADRDLAVADRKDEGLETGFRPKLLEQAGHVGADRLPADVEADADVVVAEALRQEPEDGPLPVREDVERRLGGGIWTGLRRTRVHVVVPLAGRLLLVPPSPVVPAASEGGVRLGRALER
jgi:hypothetical protein